MMMYAVRGDTLRAICIIAEHIKRAALTQEEMEALMWHEVAHILYDANEFEADSFAVDHSSYDVWKSAIRKLYDIDFTVPSGEYSHRLQLVI